MSGKLLYLWILFFCAVVLCPCMAYDEYTPVFDVNDPYLVVPLSKETAKKINDIKKSFGETGDVPLDKRNLSSHITMVEQYFSVNADGSVDFRETGDFYIVKQSGDDGVLFKRRLPFTKISDANNVFYRNIRPQINKPYLFSVDKEGNGVAVTFKSRRTSFDEDVGLSGKYVIKARIFNLVREFDDHNSIDFVTSADDFSIPVDRLFVSSSFAKTGTKIFRKEAFVMTGEMRRSEDASVTGGKAVFRLGNRLLSEQVFTAHMDFDKNIDGKIREDLGEDIKKIETASVNINKDEISGDEFQDTDNKRPAFAVEREKKGESKEGSGIAVVAVVFAALVFGYYYFVWKVFGKGNKNILPTAARKVPEDVSIAEAVVLYKGAAFDIRESLALSMIDMAIKGFLLIDYDKDNNTVLFIRTDKPSADATDEDERFLLDGFFKEHDAVEFPSDYRDDDTFNAYAKRLRDYRSVMLDGNSWVGKVGAGLIAFIAAVLAMKVSAVYLVALAVGCVYLLFYRMWFLSFKANDCPRTPRSLAGLLGLTICSSVFMGMVPYTLFMERDTFSSVCYMIVILAMTFILGTHLFFTAVLRRPKENAARVLALVKGFRDYMSSRREVVAPSLYRKFLPYALLLGYEERLGITADVPDFFAQGSHYDNLSLREIEEIIVTGCEQSIGGDEEENETSF